MERLRLAWLIGVARADVGSVFKPESCELRFDRRHGRRQRWSEIVWKIHDTRHARLQTAGLSPSTRSGCPEAGRARDGVHEERSLFGG